MDRNFIPGNDRAFFIWLKNMVAYIVSKGLDYFNIPNEEFDTLSTQATTFEQKLNIAEEPDTRTKSAVQAKNDARETVEKTARIFVKRFLNNNPLVTNADRDNKGLPIYKDTRTPAPVATTYPDFDIDSSIIRRLSVHFYDQGSKKSKAKPEGQHGVEIRWAMTDTPPATIAELTNSSFDTHTPFILNFEENQRGKSIYFCLSWENTRGEKGPWSEIQSAIVP
jgi:hypothetical protein